MDSFRSERLDPEARYRDALEAYFGWLGASVGHVLDMIGDRDLFDLLEQNEGDLTSFFRGYREERHLRLVFREYELARDYLIESIVDNDPDVRRLRREIEDYAIVPPHYLIDSLDLAVDLITSESRERELTYLTDELIRLLSWD